MAKIESHAPGTLCWVELATSDPASARTFYSNLFGWTPVDQPNNYGPYTIFQSGGNDTAAMCQLHQPEARPYWSVYFAVADAAESAGCVTALGGKVLQGPFDVQEFGRMVACTDPQGAHFCLWQAKKHIGITHPGPFGQVCWPELATPDPEAAAAFYTRLFGWKTKPEAGFDSIPYAEFQQGEKSLGGLMPMRGPEWKGVPPHWMIYVSVKNCDEDTNRAKELGATVCVPPTDIPDVGRFSVITDAQGAVFSLIQLNAMTASTAP
jgi:hypothetical protein